MMSFNRGDVVHHKIMGAGIVLNKVTEKNEEKIEVRMKNGQIERYYPEELEADEVIKAREKKQVNEIMRSNAKRRVGL